MKSVGFSITRLLLTVLIIVFVCFVMLLLITYHHPPLVNARQMAQLISVDTMLELFKFEFDDYPPSDALDEDGTPYCGAMKLCEAALGRDLMGVHPRSQFRQDGTDDSGNPLYDSNTFEVRKGPYLPLDNANPYHLKDLYEDVGPFDGNDYVICDTFKQVTHISTGKRIGMPVLYYKANTSKTAHDINDPNNPENIYNYRDNHALLALGVPGKPGLKHPLYEDPKILYEIAWDDRANGPSRPKRADTFILLSAGKDGLYGTKDDITNFEFRWKRK
ncbi:MAG: hypothetical protein ABIF19_08930 [Planctomycetota bacterium]